MTTILADAHLGIVVSDSQATDEDRKWSVRKVWRVRGELLGFAGTVSQADLFLNWYRGGCEGKPPKMDELDVLVLNAAGLFHYERVPFPHQIESGREAIGTGAKAAMVGYELLGWKDPSRVVRVVCKHDAGSRAPVRVYKF